MTLGYENRQSTDYRAEGNGVVRVKNTQAEKPSVVIRIGNVDYVISVVVTILVLIGIVMVFSSSYYVASTVKFENDTFRFLKKQGAAALVGFAAMFFMSNFSYKNLKLFAFPMYIIANILLVLVQFLGEEINGAKRWFQLPVVGSLQPSEIAKIGLILFISFIISKKKEPLKTWKDHFVVFGIIGITAGLVAWGNLSTAIIAFIIGFGIMFIASPYILRFVAMAGAGVAAVAGIIMFSDPFRLERIQAWLHPENYASGTGYQTLQSLYAIGSGGFFGLGLGQSRQKMGFIPEAHNDIIFSIICEELGFMGALLILCLFALLIWRGIRVALNAVDLFGSFVAAGIVIMLASQVIINIAVVTNTIPSTGVPLPFISYGGTSLAITMFSMGILLNISRFSKE